MKDKYKKSRISAFRINEVMTEATEELGFGADGPSTKTGWLEFVLADYLKRELKGKIHEGQRISACSPNAVFELFVNYRKAMRKEPGYRFMTGRYVLKEIENGH